MDDFSDALPGTPPTATKLQAVHSLAPQTTFSEKAGIELHLVGRSVHLYVCRIPVPDPESYETRKDLEWRKKLAS